MTNPDRYPRSVTERLVTVGEIAEIAEVGPSAVSNWRKRHGNFPLAIEKRPTGELFRLGQVIAWLESEGKQFSLPDHSLAKQLERDLWDWSTSVRGVLPAAEYLDLPLQLLCLRRESGRAVGPALGANWRKVVDAPPHGVVAAIRKALTLLGQRRPEIALALEPTYALDKLEPSALLTLVERIESLELEGPDPIGEVVSGLVEEFGRRIGKRAEFYTPSGVRGLMLEVLKPINGRVYDPACGTALFLASAWRSRDSDDVELYGQEMNEGSWRRGVLNLVLNDAAFDLGRPADTLKHDAHRELRADRIALDPPFGVKLLDFTWLEQDERWEFGPPGKSSELAWAQHLVWHLTERGVGVMVCPPGVLVRGGREMAIRRSLVGADLLDAVIQLPEGVLPTTSIPPVLLVFQKRRENRGGRVLFIDARELGKAERGKIHELEKHDIDKISSAVRAWRRGSFEGEPSFSSAVGTDDLEREDWSLAVQRHIEYLVAPGEIEGEPIAERFARLHQKLDAEAKAIRDSLAELTSDLGAIGEGDPATDWPVHSLGELLEIPPATGVRQPGRKTGRSVPFIKTELVSGGRPSLWSVAKDETVKAPKDRLVRRGDLLLVARGVDRDKAVGCAKVEFDEQAGFAGSLVRLRVNEERILADYLRLFLTSRQGLRSLRAVATGTVITNLPKAGLLRLQVPVPALSIQQEIVEAIQPLEKAMAEVSGFRATLLEQHDVLREGLISGALETKQ